jgi:hypothetical protein
MKNYTIRLNVEKFGPVEIDVTENMYKKFAEYYEKKYSKKEFVTPIE